MIVKETLDKSFDELRTNGKLLIPFVVMLSLTKHRTMSGIHLFSVSLTGSGPAPEARATRSIKMTR